MCVSFLREIGKRSCKPTAGRSRPFLSGRTTGITVGVIERGNACDGGVVRSARQIYYVHADGAKINQLFLRNSTATPGVIVPEYTFAHTAWLCVHVVHAFSCPRTPLQNLTDSSFSP